MGGSTVIILRAYRGHYGYTPSPDPWNDSGRRREKKESDLESIVDFPKDLDMTYDYLNNFPDEPTDEDLAVLYSIAWCHKYCTVRENAVEKLGEHRFNRKKLWKIFLTDERANVRKAAYEAVPFMYRPLLGVLEIFGAV